MIRGVSDIVGVLPDGRGIFVEVKKSKADARKNDKTVIGQRKFLQNKRRNGAFACFVYPENFKEMRDYLLQYTGTIINDRTANVKPKSTSPKLS